MAYCNFILGIFEKNVHLPAFRNRALGRSGYGSRQPARLLLLFCSPSANTLNLLSLNATMHRRTATNIFPTPPTTISLSKAMTIAAGTTFTPTQPYTRYDRGSGACNGQAEGVIYHYLHNLSRLTSNAGGLRCCIPAQRRRYPEPGRHRCQPS